MCGGVGCFDGGDGDGGVAGVVGEVAAVRHVVAGVAEGEEVGGEEVAAHGGEDGEAEGG